MQYILSFVVMPVCLDINRSNGWKAWINVLFFSFEQGGGSAQIPTNLTAASSFPNGAKEYPAPFSHQVTCPKTQFLFFFLVWLSFISLPKIHETLAIRVTILSFPGQFSAYVAMDGPGNNICNIVWGVFQEPANL